MPLTKTKDEKPGKVRRFLEYLGIKKKKPANPSPDLQRFELDNLIDDINHYVTALPNNHPRKNDVKNAIISLEKQAEKDIRKAIDLAQGVLEWAADELKNANHRPQQPAPPQPIPPVAPQVQATAPQTLPVQPQSNQATDSSIPVPPPPPPPGFKKAKPQAPPAPPQQAPPPNVPAPPPPPPITAESLKQFQPEKALGSGNYATTYKMNGPGGQAVAVKVPKIKDQPKTEDERQLAAEELAKKEEEFKREAEFYEKVGEHPNIAKCYGYQTVGDGDAKQSGLVLELVEGKTANDTMADLRGKYLSGEMSAEEYFGVMQYTLKKMLEAADHMGKQGVSHRDLKPDNVMIDGNTGNVKVVDFGVSQVVGQAPDPSAIPLGYAAPEIDGTSPTNPVEDSFGVGATGYLWSEQEMFKYKQPNEPLSKSRGEFTSASGPAIDVESDDAVEPKDEEQVFQKLLDKVETNLAKWEESGAKNTSPSEAQQIRDLAAQGRDHGEKKNYSDGVVLMRSLSATLKAALAGGDTAEQRYAESLKDIVAKVDRLEDSVIRSSGLADPGRYKSQLEAVRPLLAKAKQHGDRMEYALGSGVFEEIDRRLADADADSGKHSAETLYTDFINQLMDPDPKKRLTPEQALNHPFMKNALLDDDAAKRVLQMQNPPPGGAADPGNNAPDEKRYQVLDRAVVEAERQIKELRAALPQQAAERQSLLAQMKGLLEPAQRAKQTADDAWEAFRGLDAQLKTLLAAAKKDQHQRKQVQADISRVGRLLKALASRTNADPADYKDLFRQAEVAAKPGGSLDAANESLLAIQLKLNEQFSADEKLELLRDALAQAEDQLQTVLARASLQANLASDLLQDAEPIFDQARQEAVEARKLKTEGNEEAAKFKTAQADRTKKKANDKKRDAADNQKIGENLQRTADEATKVLQKAQDLAQTPAVDVALDEVDRACELLRVSLAEATGAASRQAPSAPSPQDDNNATSEAIQQVPEEREEIDYENQRGDESSSTSNQSQPSDSQAQPVHTETEFNERAPKETKGEEVEYSSTE